MNTLPTTPEERNAGFYPTSLEQLEALVVWGVWHEVDSGVTSVIVSNAQIARAPQHAQMDLPHEEGKESEI